MNAVQPKGQGGARGATVAALRSNHGAGARHQARQRRSRDFRGCPVAEAPRAAHPSLCRRVSGPRVLPGSALQRQRGGPVRSIGSDESQESPSPTEGGAEDSGGFHWVTAVSKTAVLPLAIKQAVQSCLSQLPHGAKPTLAVVFVSSRFATAYSSVVPNLQRLVPSLEVVVGSSGFGVIGSSIPQAVDDGEAAGEVFEALKQPPEEVEMVPAISVTLAVLPGVNISTFRVTPGTVPDADAPPDRWADLVGAPLPTTSAALQGELIGGLGGATGGAEGDQQEAEGDPEDKQQEEEDREEEDTPHFIILSDPSFAEVHDVLQGLDYAYPTSTKVGGLSSSVSMQEQWCTFCSGGRADLTGEVDTGAKYGGLVGIALWGGGLAMEAVVAQGCRPVGGDTYTVVDVQAPNLVTSVEDGSGRVVPPLRALQELVVRLTPEEQELVQTSIMVAIAQDSFKSLEELETGDFLIRGLQGADPDTGALALQEYIKIGQRMRFMVRDKQGAVQDLQQHMQDFKRRELARSFMGSSGGDASAAETPFGALLFACNGRGLGLFSEPSFDSRTFAEYIPVGVGGYFCNGEIGQVGASTYLHGFTAVFGVLKAKRRSS